MGFFSTITRVAAGIATGGASEIVRAAVHAAGGSSAQAALAGTLGAGALVGAGVAGKAGLMGVPVAAAITRGAGAVTAAPYIIAATNQQNQRSMNLFVYAPGGGPPQPGVGGGPPAFSGYGISGAGGGNPAWQFLGTSAGSSAPGSIYSGCPGARWVQSGTSVRLSCQG